MTKKKIFFTPPAQKHIEQKVDEWVKSGGITISNDRSSDEVYRLSLDLPKFLHRRIKKACAIEGISMKEKLNKILLEAFPEN